VRVSADDGGLTIQPAQPAAGAGETPQEAAE
jgi:hypothetical protein